MKTLFLYGLMVSMLLSGAANKIFSKMQNSTKSNGQKFYHPFFQTFLLFFGETLCLLLYFIIVCRRKYGKEELRKEHELEVQKAKAKGLRTDVNVFIFLIPTVIDVISSTCGFIALNFIEASVYLMLNSSGLFFIILFSRIFVKRKLYRHHLLAIPLIIGAEIIVGYASLVKSSGHEKQESKWIGFVFVILTQSFGALFYVSEEFLLRKYYLHPLKVAGWEGIFGIIIYAGILTVLQFIPCSGKLCPQGRLDNTEQTFIQLRENYWLIIFLIGLIITHALYNGFGVSVTKYASSAQRSTLNSCRTIVVWGFFLIFTGPGHEIFSWIQLVGFIILIFGTLIFNEILVLPFLGLDKYTKKNMGMLPNGELIEDEDDRTKKSTKMLSFISSDSPIGYPGVNESARGGKYTRLHEDQS